jgi:hypothetical protein
LPNGGWVVHEAPSTPFLPADERSGIGVFRNVASKVMWVGRTASMVFGLALVMALVLGVAATAWSATGENFILGKGNVATAITRLTGAEGVDGPMLRIRNNNADPNDTALRLWVQTGEAPMRVNSDTKVANLNADMVDGTDASQLATNTSEGWHEIGAPGEPTFGDGWSNGTPSYICSGQSAGCVEYNTAGFYKDSLGVVHLKGSIKLDLNSCNGCSSIAFRLPEGYRPARAAVFDPASDRGDNNVFVLYDGHFQLSSPDGFSGTYNYSLDGITFRAEN